MFDDELCLAAYDHTIQLGHIITMGMSIYGVRSASMWIQTTSMFDEELCLVAYDHTIQLGRIITMGMSTYGVRSASMWIQTTSMFDEELCLDAYDHTIQLGRIITMGMSTYGVRSASMWIQTTSMFDEELCLDAYDHAIQLGHIITIEVFTYGFRSRLNLHHCESRTVNATQFVGLNHLGLCIVPSLLYAPVSPKHPYIFQNFCILSTIPECLPLQIVVKCVIADQSYPTYHPPSNVFEAGHFSWC